jgi:hypothetical protein
VAADDLGAIHDLQDKHRRVLAEELKITTLRALVHADRRDIHQAMRHLRPRPTLEQIALWQDQAMSRMSEGATDRSDWHPAASFAVVFAQRPADGGGWERRLEVERTEVEPEREGRIWPGWECREICRWMREQLGLPGGAELATGKADQEETGPQEPAGRPVPPGDAEPAPSHPGKDRGRGELRIGRVTLIDPGAQVVPAAAGAAGAPPVDVVTARAAATAQPAAPTGALRVEITVSGARRGQEIHAVARVLPRDRPGWNLQDPLVIKGTSAASFDLSGLPAGQHDVALIAWAPDGTMQPITVTLPGLTVQPPHPPEPPAEPPP